ncbi:type II secretion system protein GspM [Alteromonas sp. CYL-A6]|uniref:type II secretion system protein GspM n=1 Tax=Alteromonas nitratireducens TaxID=3390813 RepID=UPI0034B5B0A2
MNALAEKYRALTEREQRLVALSGVVMLIAAFYFLVWSPLTTGIERERALLDEQQALLGWVEDTVARAQQLKRTQSGNSAFKGSLPQAVNRTTAQHNIAIARMQPQGEELQVWINDAPFNDVVAWLKSMEDIGVVILQADITEADTAGYIKVRRLQLGKA